jgi:hypothetical protein
LFLGQRRATRAREKAQQNCESFLFHEGIPWGSIVEKYEFKVSAILRPPVYVLLRHISLASVPRSRERCRASAKPESRKAA